MIRSARSVLGVTPLVLSSLMASAQTTAPAHTASPLDAVVETLFSAHTFEQAAISPDGKRVAWVETLQGRNGAPTGHTAIYVSDVQENAPPHR